VIDLAVQDLLHGIDDPATARHHAVNAVAGLIPQRHAHRSTLAVGAALAASIEFAIFTGGATEQVGLFASSIWRTRT
jgi:hypothetical protein